jgi:hypothetical protein
VGLETVGRQKLALGFLLGGEEDALALLIGVQVGLPVSDVGLLEAYYHNKIKWGQDEQMRAVGT